METDGLRQGILRLALVQPGCHALPQRWIEEPREREERALKTTQLPQSQGQAVLPRIARQLTEDE